jgi:hypothetical protein
MRRCVVHSIECTEQKFKCNHWAKARFLFAIKIHELKFVAIELIPDQITGLRNSDLPIRNCEYSRSVTGLRDSDLPTPLEAVSKQMVRATNIRVLERVTDGVLIWSFKAYLCYIPETQTDSI